MKIMKKIGAIVCAAAISVSIISAMPVGAYYAEFTGGATLVTAQMPSWGRRICYVKAGKYGSINCGEIFMMTYNNKSSAETKSVAGDFYYYDDQGEDHTMSGHQARISSGGKFKESPYMVWKSDAYSGRLKVYGGKSRVQAYYRYK